MKKMLFPAMIVALSLHITSISVKAQTLEWAVDQTCNGVQGYGNGVARNLYNESYVTGEFSGTMTLGTGTNSTTLNSVSGRTDCYLAKYTASGQFLWGFSMGATQHDGGTAVEVDNQGNVILVGYFRDSMDLNPLGSRDVRYGNGFEDCFIAKYSSTSGQLLWGHTFGGSLSDKAYEIAISDLGDVYVSGHFRSTVNFDPGATNTTVSTVNLTWDGFIVRYTPNGQFLWVKQLGGTGNVFSTKISIGLNNNLIATGRYAQNLDLDPSPALDTVNSGSIYSSIFLALYNSSGVLQWKHNIGDSVHQQHFTNACFDPSGNVYVFAQTASPMDMNPTSGIDSIRSKGAFLSKYDPNGNYLWGNAFETIPSANSIGTHTMGLAADHQGNVYITGGFKDTLDMDPTNNQYLILGNGLRMFLAKYSGNGALAWAFTNTSTGPGQGADYGIDMYLYHDTIYLTGWFADTVDFDPGPASYKLVSTYGHTPYLAKYYCGYPTSVKSSQDMPLKVYPNPANGSVFLELPRGVGHAQVEIYNQFGQLVLTRTVSQGSRSQIDLSGINSGLYVVRWDDGQSINSTKLIVR